MPAPQPSPSYRRRETWTRFPRVYLERRRVAPLDVLIFGSLISVVAILPIQRVEGGVGRSHRSECGHNRAVCWRQRFWEMVPRDIAIVVVFGTALPRLGDIDARLVLRQRQRSQRRMSTRSGWLANRQHTHTVGTDLVAGVVTTCC